MKYEITDAVKWAYQSAFGCGHLLPALDVCQRRIAGEMQETPVRDIPAYEAIGCGLCRLNLANAQVRRLGPNLIARMMKITDETVRARENNQERFERLLDDMRKPFDEGDWNAYMADYRAMGCPPVSHSESYRKAHQPAYRVVLEAFGLLLPAIGHPLVVIDGPCGSGKTTLAGLLGRLYDAVPIPMDDFFLLPRMRTEERLSQPGGNVHYERFHEEVLSNLVPGEEVRWRRFDCQSWQMMDRIAPKAEVTIIEGSYSHHPAFRKRYEELGALRVFVDVSPEEQLRRIGKRDPELLSMFTSRWIPLEKTYFQAYDIKGRAGVILQSPEERNNEP